jgi:hypothetical protein
MSPDLDWGRDGGRSAAFIRIFNHPAYLIIHRVSYKLLIFPISANSRQGVSSLGFGF